MLRGLISLCMVPVVLSIIVKDPPPKNGEYTYHYEIADPTTGDTKSQREVRKGEVVSGAYTVVDPDGTKRTVEYTADPANGFTAVIHKEKAAAVKAPQIQNHVPSVNEAFSSYKTFESQPPVNNFAPAKIEYSYAPQSQNYVVAKENDAQGNYQNEYKPTSYSYGPVKSDYSSEQRSQKYVTKEDNNQANYQSEYKPLSYSYGTIKSDYSSAPRSQKYVAKDDNNQANYQSEYKPPSYNYGPANNDYKSDYSAVTGPRSQEYYANANEASAHYDYQSQPSSYTQKVGPKSDYSSPDGPGSYSDKYSQSPHSYSKPDYSDHQRSYFRPGNDIGSDSPHSHDQYFDPANNYYH